MAQARVEVRVVGTAEAKQRLDQISQAENRLNAAFKRGQISSDQLKRSTARLRAAQAVLAKSLNTTSANLRRSSRSAQGLSGSLTRVNAIAGAVGLTFGAWQIVRILRETLAVVADFEAEMNRVRALTSAVSVEFRKLEELAKELGSTTQFSARQAAGGMAFLAQAGFKTNEILGAMPATLRLAAAAQLDLASSADIVSNVMAGFGIKTEDLGSAVDVLTQAFTSANTDLIQLGQAMKLAGPVAKRFGLTFEETAAAIALMGNAGFQSTLAGTALRGTIIRLARDAKKFGIEVFDTQGKLLGLAELMDRVNRAGLSETKLFELLGQRAGPAFAALLSQGSGALRDLTRELENSGGRAEAVANIQLEGLKGQTIQLTSAIEGLKIAIGDAGLREFAQDSASALTILTRALTDFVKSDDVKTGLLVIEGSFFGIAEALRRFQVRAAMAKQEMENFEEIVKRNARALPTFQDALDAIRETEEGFAKAIKKAADGADDLKDKFDLVSITLSDADVQVLKLTEDLRALQELEKGFKSLPSIILAPGDQQLIELTRQLEAAQAAEEELARKAAKVQAAHQAAFQQMQLQIEGFLQQVFVTARSFGDVWRQLMQQVLRVFVSAVSQMIAAWVLGLGRIRAASAGGLGGGGGGILGTILGPLFGGGLFGARTPPFVPSSASSLAATPATSGQGFLTPPGQATISGTVTSIGSSGGATAGLLQNLRGIGPISGGAVASGGIFAALTAIGLGAGRGSPLLGALGGAAGGALAGFAFGGPIGAAIGAIVGAIAGLLGGIFGRGRLKNRAARTEDEFVAVMADIIKDVQQFRATAEEGIMQLQEAFAQFQQAVKPFGFAGRRAVRNVTPLFNQVLSDLERLGSQRRAGQELLAGLPIQEFQHGGLVRGINSVDGRMLAILERGEFVLKPRVVQQLGVERLERLNRAPESGGGATIHLGPVIIQGANKDGRQLYHEIAREANRRAKDRGLPPPF